jgi:hypothetical protein
VVVAVFMLLAQPGQAVLAAVEMVVQMGQMQHLEPRIQAAVVVAVVQIRLRQSLAPAVQAAPASSSSNTKFPHQQPYLPSNPRKSG